jgi:hypothetical protein
MPPLLPRAREASGFELRLPCNDWGTRYRLDSFVQAVAHKNAAGRVIIDGVFSWTKKGHDRTLDAVAAICRRYG